MAMARAAAEARQAYLMSQSAGDVARLATADRIYQEGDVRVAGRMYVQVALSRPKNQATAEARQRLVKLADEARQKLGKIDADLVGQGGGLSPGELIGPDGQPTAPWAGQIAAAFRQYDDLVEDYGRVPVADREIKTHIAKQRRRPEFAAVLNEPEAKALWELGQQHEAKDHACCAYWVYREAARLAPARSARLALERFEQMEQDADAVAAAKACRELRQCHKIYNRAELLIANRPARAKELFAQIVQRAPEDSEIYRAAREHVQRLKY